MESSHLGVVNMPIKVI